MFILLQLTHPSKDAHKYETDFQEAIQMLCEETESHRLWISSKWSDTPEGNGKDVKLLDYACGPGYISRVCVFICLEKPNHAN
jgi:hypothetical protein